MTPVTNIETLHETIFVKLYNNNLFDLAELTFFKTVCVHYLHTSISLQSAVKKTPHYPLHQDLKVTTCMLGVFNNPIIHD